MELYILDVLLRPIDIVDEFVSLIWVERFSVKGDFQLVTFSTPSNRRRFVLDTLLSINESKRVMRIATIEETIDEDNGAILKITGVDLVSIFEQRVIAWTEAGMLESVSTYHGWTPLEIMDRFVWWMCVPAGGKMLSPGDNIPFLQDFHEATSLYPSDTLPQPGSMIWEQKIANLYSALVDVAKAYDIGFRLYKDPNASKLHFEGYCGSDRTSAQTLRSPVVFSSDMTNLQNTTEYSDNSKQFNVVFAIYEYKNPVEGALPEVLTIHEMASDPELVFSSGGFDQKTKTITITQLPKEVTMVEAPEYLQQLATEELTKSRPISIYDGEIDKTSDFVYERDYFLGDLVEVRGNNGGAAYMRVEEQIIKFDATGKSSYPSLVTKTSINPGTWRSWKYDVDWVDMGSGEYWDNQ